MSDVLSKKSTEEENFSVSSVDDTAHTDVCEEFHPVKSVDFILNGTAHHAAQSYIHNKVHPVETPDIISNDTANNAAQADVYGQIHPVETPELIANGLTNLEEELSKIPDKKKKALQQALIECPDVVNDSHKLMFLRCEVFNAKLAAKRLVKYWAKRLEIFGKSKAFKPLTYANIYNDVDDTSLRIVMFRSISGLDKTGRGLAFGDPSTLDPTKYAREDLIKSFWYIIHAGLEGNISAQQKGVILLCYTRHVKMSHVDNKMLKMAAYAILGFIPMRISAFHIIYPPFFVKIILPFIGFLLGPRLKKRIRFHSGSDEDIFKSLENFGIAMESIPVEIGGKAVLDHDFVNKERITSGC